MNILTANSVHFSSSSTVREVQPLNVNESKDAETQNGLNQTVTFTHSQSTQFTYGPQGTIGSTSVESTSISVRSGQNQASGNILKFIDAQIQRDIADGATEEALTSRLAAGLEGFLKGFGEAYTQLEESGLLDESVTAAIADTYNQVLQGIDDIAQSLALESPVTESQKDRFSELAAPVTAEGSDLESVPVVQNNPNQSDLAVIEEINASLTSSRRDSEQDVEAPSSALALANALGLREYGASQSETRAFDFSLLTQEGDRISIRLLSANAQSFSVSENGQSASVEQFGQFAFEVDGELSEQELGAINELLSQIGEIADSFFGGNLLEAFDQALSIGFDSDQIARFALNLQREQVTRVDTTYNTIANIDPLSSETEKILGEYKDNTLIQVSRFIEMLEAIREKSESVNIQIESVVQVASFVAQERYAENQHVEKFEPTVARLFSSLESIASTRTDI